MIIHEPELTLTPEEAILSAKIEFSQPNVSLPDRLWFAFPFQYEPLLTTRSDPFAVALLQTSQFLGEKLEVRGALSEVLAYGLDQYGRIFHTWFPKWFSLPDLSINKFSSPNPPDEPKVGMAFSGGVDSFYTLFCHLKQNQPIPSAQVNTALFIHGMDIRFYQAQAYRQRALSYQRMFDQLEIQLITARMNCYLFWEHRLRWEYVHGAPLIATALCLSNLFSRFYIPSTHRYDHLLPNATSPLTDHWLSTETLRIIHHGADQSRLDKLNALANWQECRNNLRVCTNPLLDEDQINCGKCNKCLRTMIMLELLDALPTFTTFPDTLNWGTRLKYILTAPGQTYPRLIYRYALSKKNIRGIIIGLMALLVGKTRRSLSESLINILSKDQIYRLKHRVYRKFTERTDRY
jgi:predicted PP-loop superfamily ATPase